MANRDLFDICIIGGCGRAGLPLGLAFANKRKKVALYDINDHAVQRINNKEMPFLERGAPKILERTIDSKMLVATNDFSVLEKAKTLIIVIGTPVDEHLCPKVNDVMDLIKQIIPILRDDQLIILRSTLYPGLTKKISEFIFAQGKNTKVSFCPERIAEGHALEELSSLPQIVSAFDEDTLKRVNELFQVLTPKIVKLSPIEAELAKLFTNTWRYINFAISNQFFMISQGFGLDFYKIYEGMIENYPRLQGFAKAGFAAGPCLFKDTMQLSAFSNNNFFMGHAAMLVNEGMPNFLVENLKTKVEIGKSTVGILGMAFKANSDDIRESLSYKLRKILELEATRVLYSDAYISSPEFIPAEDLVEQADIVILGVPHKEYKKLDLKGKPFVDIWNFFEKTEKLI